jgi:hypothetical protein
MWPCLSGSCDTVLIGGEARYGAHWNEDPHCYSTKVIEAWQPVENEIKTTKVDVKVLIARERSSGDLLSSFIL